MKIIHTADWHVGHQLYGYDRGEEFERFFDQLAGLMRRERPDALLVSGDIYDSYVPSAGAVRLLNTALLRLHDAAPETEIILTSGNHDSGARLEASAAPWTPHRVHFVGSIDPSLGLNRIPIGDRGVVMAIPFCYPANFPHDEEDPSEGRQERFFSRAAERLAGEAVPAVLMAHLYLPGARLNGGRQPRDIAGGTEAMDLSRVAAGYDYLALGHIHRRQRISERAYYSGSPLPISFDEPARHDVLLVEAERGREPVVTPVPITVPRPLLTLPATALPYAEALESLAALDPEEEVYIRLHVTAEPALPVDHLEQTLRALEGKKARYCTLKVEYPARPGDEAAEGLSIRPEELRDYSPRKIAEIYFRDEGISHEEQAELLDLIDHITLEPQP